MTQWELAQFNMAQPVAPLDSAALVDFVANLDRINSLADDSPGFIWRLKEDSSDAGGLNKPFTNDLILNMSVWQNVDALHSYVYQSGHIEVMRRRKDWFEPINSVSAVLWWVPKGHIPNLYEAKERLMLLEQDGPTQRAFTFKKRMPCPTD